MDKPIAVKKCPAYAHHAEGPGDGVADNKAICAICSCRIQYCPGCEGWCLHYKPSKWVKMHTKLLCHPGRRMGGPARGEKGKFVAAPAAPRVRTQTGHGVMHLFKEVEDILIKQRAEKPIQTYASSDFVHGSFKSAKEYLARRDTGSYFAVVKGEHLQVSPAAIARAQKVGNNLQVNPDVQLGILTADSVKRDVEIVGGDDRFLNMKPTTSYDISGTKAAICCIKDNGMKTPIHRHGLPVWNRHWWGKRKYWLLVEDTSGRWHRSINKTLVQLNKKDGGAHINDVIKALNKHNRRPPCGETWVKWHIVLMGQEAECDGDLLLMLPGVWHFVLTCGEQLGAHGYLTPGPGMEWLVRSILKFNAKPPIDWVEQFKGHVGTADQRQDQLRTTWTAYFEGRLAAVSPPPPVGSPPPAAVSLASALLYAPPAGSAPAEQAASDSASPPLKRRRRGGER